MPFIDGFLVGFAMVIFVGPVLFTILQIAFGKGFWAGIMASLGVFISDVIAVIICYQFSNSFLKNSIDEFWLSILGSIILFSIGFSYVLKPNLNISTIDKISNLSLFTAFLKGFLVNFVNPFVFGVWIAVICLAKQKYTTENDILIYLIAATLAVLVTDTLKVLFANKIRPLLKPTLLAKVYKVSGFALILFGIRVLAHLFYI